ncbi:MAG: GNAT family N-acetyltransferase [Candidatus Woesearchaeota archaeon]|nr:GNAT family N-acetyltransferase [Candidatus Woesearchaeota archaeon]
MDIRRFSRHKEDEGKIVALLDRIGSDFIPGPKDCLDGAPAWFSWLQITEEGCIDKSPYDGAGKNYDFFYTIEGSDATGLISVIYRLPDVSPWHGMTMLKQKLENYSMCETRSLSESGAYDLFSSAAYVSTFFVSKEYRRVGLGSMLEAALFKDLYEERDIQDVILKTFTSGQKIMPGFNYYMTRGWNKIGEMQYDPERTTGNWIRKDSEIFEKRYGTAWFMKNITTKK